MNSSGSIDTDRILGLLQTCSLLPSNSTLTRVAETYIQHMLIDTILFIIII